MATPSSYIFLRKITLNPWIICTRVHHKLHSHGSGLQNNVPRNVWRRIAVDRTASGDGEQGGRRAYCIGPWLELQAAVDRAACHPAMKEQPTLLTVGEEQTVKNWILGIFCVPAAWMEAPRNCMLMRRELHARGFADLHIMVVGDCER